MLGSGDGNGDSIAIPTILSRQWVGNTLSVHSFDLQIILHEKEITFFSANTL